MKHNNLNDIRITKTDIFFTEKQTCTHLNYKQI